MHHVALFSLYVFSVTQAHFNASTQQRLPLSGMLPGMVSVCQVQIMQEGRQGKGRCVCRGFWIFVESSQWALCSWLRNTPSQTFQTLPALYPREGSWQQPCIWLSMFCQWSVRLSARASVRSGRCNKVPQDGQLLKTEVHSSQVWRLGRPSSRCLTVTFRNGNHLFVSHMTEGQDLSGAAILRH